MLVYTNWFACLWRKQCCVCELCSNPFLWSTSTE